MVNRRPWAALATCSSGASAAEFALILPVLLLVMFGTLQISMLMYSYNVMVDAARDTTRAMAVCTITDATEATSRALDNLSVLPWLARGDFDITPATAGTDVSMTISTDPAKAAILAYVPFGLGTLTAHVTMRKEPLAFGGGPCGGA